MELHSWEEVLKVLLSERQDRKVPRVKDNPYGDNTIGMAFDEGWWSALRWAKTVGLFTASEEQTHKGTIEGPKGG